MTSRPGVWSIAARADEVSTEGRASVAEVLERERPSRRALLLVTCHRVELIGVGPSPHPHGLSARVRGIRFLAGDAAVEHVLRLAAGLECAVLGEDQILHQLRDAHGLALARETLDPGLGRLMQVALGVGRRARAAGRPAERSLADRALRRAEARGVVLTDATVLVAGTGPIGRKLARGARRHGARVLLASRRVGRAQDAAARLGADALDLDAAAWRAPAADVVLVALAGPWAALEAVGPEALPLVVDLSAPSALSEPFRGRLGDRFIGLDDLFDPTAPESEEAARYRLRAEALVAEAMADYLAWLEARASADAVQALRQRAEALRREGLERLLRRLPDLDDRERELIVAHSQQLVAALLHEPLARLHRDRDGTSARAARDLFRL